MDKENIDPNDQTLVQERYRAKQKELRQHLKIVDQLKFELMELLIELENEKLSERLQSKAKTGKTEHAIYKQAHQVTTAELRVLDDVQNIPTSPTPLQQIKKKASLLNDDWNPMVQQLGQELHRKTSRLNQNVQVKTSQFFNDLMVNLSPQKSPTRSPLRPDVRGRILFDQEVQVVDIDDYESDDDFQRQVMPQSVI